MRIKELTLSCCLVLPGVLSADCNTPISVSDVPSFIAPESIDSYLADARVRQNKLCSNDKGMGQDKAIYITDNRYDAYLAKGAVREAARSTAALIKREYLTKQGNEYVINHGATLQTTGWCSSESFASQPVTANCTAFLVADNTLVTAGHCLRNRQGKIPLDTYYVVFGYQMNNKNQAKTRFPAADVYQIQSELEVKKNSGQDWAVVTLDRAVKGRQVFEFASGEISQGTELVIFGYPNGLPLKISDGGSVKRNQRQRTVFDTDLDSYHGNSGSPVLNSQALKQGRFLVEGILVSGASDSKPNGRCKVSVTCASIQLDNAQHDCSGEQVTKINRVLELDATPAESYSAPTSSSSDTQDVMKLFQ